MGLEIGWFSFDGPHDSPGDLQADQGVYVVLAAEEGGKFTLLEADQAEDVTQGIATHPRRECWEKNRGNGLQYAVLYTPDLASETRQQIVKEIRMEYVMPCSPPETPTRGYWRPEEQ